MNTVELLLKTDAGKITEYPSKELEIKRLSDITGTPFMVTVRAISGRRFTELVDNIYDSKGNVSTKRAYETNILLTVAGLVSPDLKDRDLQEHFGVRTPKDLAEKIFKGGEISMIADEITELSGFGKEEKEEEEKEEEIRD